MIFKGLKINAFTKTAISDPLFVTVLLNNYVDLFFMFRNANLGLGDPLLNSMGILLLTSMHVESIL